MNHFRHALCTHTLNPAPGTEEFVDALHIKRGKLDDPQGVPTVTSYWRPSEQDIANILAGGCVAVQVLGTTQPPILVSVEM